MTRLLLPVLAACLIAPALAQQTSPTDADPAIPVASAPEAPIATLLEELGEDVQAFDEHIVTLANPFFGGRLPGTAGMEMAKEYMEYWFKRAGVQPAFPVDGKPGERSWRQPFPLSKSRSVTAATLGSSKSLRFAHESDFTVVGLGSGGEVTAPAVFVGYGIKDGLNGYDSFGELDDLSGKIAIVLRWEPMNDAGVSLWKRGRSPWSAKHSFRSKIRALSKLDPAGVIFVNVPGVDDERVDELTPTGRGGRRSARFPIAHLSRAAGERLVQQQLATSLMALRREADEAAVIKDLDGEVTMAATFETKAYEAENVGAVLPGRGALANEYVVIGGHLDHLGFGEFGSRSGSVGQLHPGADDNASGSAGVLMLAKSLSKAYAEMPEDRPLRSILFVGFTAEESGLNGSRWYVEHPIVPIEEHQLMINFDMIGRIVNRRLSLSGLESAQGMRELMQPALDVTPLDIVKSRMAGGSDHMAFMSKRVPYLFGIIADFHNDYHTPRDVSRKINRVGAVHTVHLFHDLALVAVSHPNRFEWAAQERAERRGPRRGEPAAEPASSRDASLSDMKVKFGIAPGNYDDEDPGIVVGGVTPDGSADTGGVKEGDRMVTWNGTKITDIRSWMGMLVQHKPGDKVKVGVVRDGKDVELTVTLQER